MRQLVTKEISGVSQSGGLDSFYNVFLILIDRIFGEETTNLKADTSWKRGSQGGWILSSCGLKHDGFGAFDSVMHKSSPSSVDTFDKTMLQKSFYLTNSAIEIIDLLHPAGDIFLLLTRLRRDYEVSFDLLPKKMRLRLRRQPEYEYVKSTLQFGYDSLVKCQELIHAAGSQVRRPPF